MRERDTNGCATFSPGVKSLPRRALSPDVAKFGRALRRLRQDHDLSMGELARILRCDLVRLSDVEIGSETDPRYQWCPSCRGDYDAAQQCSTCEGKQIVEVQG